MIGHDLRNPLAGIKNASYYLKKKETQSLSTQSKEMLEIIDRCVGHSNKIINDLLDYSREMRLQRKITSIDNLLVQALAMNQIPKNVTVIKQVTDPPKFKVDEEKLERVFINLIKNALDAMPDGGLISIISKEENNRYELSFSDTGIGIPKQDLPKIWDRFYRVDQSRTRKTGGTGLGLYVAKQIIEAHGGDISVKSQENEGTIFTISLKVEKKT